MRARSPRDPQVIVRHESPRIHIMPTDEQYPLHITQAFELNIPESDLDFFDANLKYDSKLFVDPFLLKRSPLEEEQRLYKRFGIYFEEALRRTLAVQSSGMRRLIHYLTFHEPKEINLGYTKFFNRGSGLSTVFANSLANFFIGGAAERLISERNLYPDQEINPEVFAAFADDVGEDRISDLTVNLIMDYLVSYTQKQCSQLGIPANKILPVNQTYDYEEKNWTGGQSYRLPENPIHPGEPIVFVPKRLLRASVPVKANIKQKVTGILSRDPILANKFQTLISKTLDNISIQEIRDVLSTEESVLRQYLISLASQERDKYDFVSDPLQYLAIKRYANYFHGISWPEAPAKCDDLLGHVQNLVNLFRECFERRGQWRDTWYKDKNGEDQPDREVAWGRIFMAMGVAYFDNYKMVTFEPEVGTGAGFVDFKVIFRECRIVMEIKKLCNQSSSGDPPLPAYLHGLRRQLPDYVDLHKAKYAFYLTGQHFKETIGKHPRNDDKKANELRALVPIVKKEIMSRYPDFEELYYENIDLSPKSSSSDR